MLTAGLLLALQTTAATPLPAPTSTPAVQARRICRSSELNTGSLVSSHRICHTAAEWHAIDGENGRAVNDFRDSMRTSSMRTSSRN